MDRVRKLLKMLFAREELELEAPPPANAGKPVRRALPDLFKLLFAIEPLPFEEPPPKKDSRLPHVARGLFEIESLETEPEEPSRPSRPVLKWLLWPESLSSSDPKKTGEK